MEDIDVDHYEELQEIFFRVLARVPSDLFPRAAMGAENNALEQALSPRLAECREMVTYWTQRAAERPEMGSIQVVLNAWKFRELVATARLSILIGVHPSLIAKGSSGSYFVYNRFRRFIAVFKPRSEEPYGFANPKWPKKVQKIMCPCMFGRACLLTNQGYLSEAGASLVDRRLGLALVPRTEVVQLSSPVFNNLFDRAAEKFGRFRVGNAELPIKTGSYQTFVHGFTDAGAILKQWETRPLPPAAHDSLVDQFQRITLLDYLIRNTDRNMDNWLVKEVKDEQAPGGLRVEVVAIDNGLAFPIHHPLGFRKFPFHWAKLDLATYPYTDYNREFADKLADEDAMSSIMAELFLMFRQDPNFSEELFLQQMSVMRGQAERLVLLLRRGGSPLELTKLPLSEPSRPVRLEDLASKLDLMQGPQRSPTHENLHSLMWPESVQEPPRLPTSLQELKRRERSAAFGSFAADGNVSYTEASDEDDDDESDSSSGSSSSDSGDSDGASGDGRPELAAGAFDDNDSSSSSGTFQDA